MFLSSKIDDVIESLNNRKNILTHDTSESVIKVDQLLLNKNTNFLRLKTANRKNTVYTP